VWIFLVLRKNKKIFPYGKIFRVVYKEKSILYTPFVKPSALIIFCEKLLGFARPIFLFFLLMIKNNIREGVLAKCDF